MRLLAFLVLVAFLILVCIDTEAESKCGRGRTSIGKGSFGKKTGGKYSKLDKSPLLKKGTKMAKGKARRATLLKFAKASLVTMMGSATIAGTSIVLDKLMDDDDFEALVYAHYEEHGEHMDPKYILSIAKQFQDNQSNETSTIIIVVSTSAVAVSVSGFIVVAVIYKNQLVQLLGRASAPVTVPAPV